MRTLHTILLASALTTMAVPASAASMNNWSVGAEVGTTGYGGSVSYRFHDNMALTAGYTGFTYDGLEHETDDVDYEGDFDMDVYGLTFDYFPFGGRFFLSAGAVKPDIAALVVGRPKDGQSYEYNGTTYTSDEVGTLRGDVTLGDSIQPYLGLGWRGSHKNGLGVFAKLGAFLTDAEVNLEATGAASDPQLRQDIQQEEDDLQDDVDEFGVYPVAVLGLEYTF
ncbi:hypothetical protein [Halomonas sp. M20]|uniref:hypothetical protein n=1 Tax=Halomonas sp. M20 TaxID=2763264 RepID=UPI001D0B735E|nr:hypothetical protein [Halomonas sp. M20]